MSVSLSKGPRVATAAAPAAFRADDVVVHATLGRGTVTAVNMTAETYPLYLVRLDGQQYAYPYSGALLTPPAPVNPFLCPVCGELAIADLNSLPGSAWDSDRQDAECERCGAEITRTVRYGAPAAETAWRRRV